MTTWIQALREGAVTGSIASVLSAAVLAWRGAARGEPAAPVNAVSHWFFGDRALREDDPSPLYTVTGFLTHHGASVFWGTLHAKAWGAQREHKSPGPALAGAAAATAVAAFVDYQLTPKRFTPGFEHRLRRDELVGVYAAFAVGLAVGTMLLAPRTRRVRAGTGQKVRRVRAGTGNEAGGAVHAFPGGRRLDGPAAGVAPAELEQKETEQTLGAGRDAG